MTPKEFKQIRESLNLTQRQLAHELDLKPKNGAQYIRMIETGVRVPSDVLLRCLELVVKMKGIEAQLKS